MFHQSCSACMAADEEKIAKTMLFPGDPLRAKAVAEQYFVDAECFNTVRGMLGYTGYYKGRRISVMGSGIGIPSATTFAYDLYNEYGVENIIRIGTAGSVQDNVHLRDLVIPMAASTNSSFSMQYSFPGALTPVADYSLLSTAVKHAETHGVAVHVGSVFTADMFFNQSPEINEKCRDMGILAIDMETAGIYWQAMALKKRAVSILTVSNHIFTGEGTTVTEQREALNNMMETALDTAWEFSEE